MRLFEAALAVQQALASAPAHPGAGAGANAVEVPRIEAAATVDGILDEPAWSQAARLTDFWQYQPVDGRRAAERTEVRVWYSPDAIHFGVQAFDREPGAIRATVADRDNIDGDDHVTIYLDTFADRRRAFFFAVNPLGVQQDGVRTEGAVTPGNISGGSIDMSPDFRFESKGRLTESGYVVEIRIPFTSLRYPGGESQRWGVQVERKVQRTGYTDTWTDARRAGASFLAQAGTLTGLHDLERGVVFEAQPYLTATATGARTLAGDFHRTGIEPEVGANLRVGFTNVSLDATVNPDFSQVEADVGQVTINERFALFYPEKRPFFLEGIELFATPNQLVHTRRVENPVVGGKVTGKLGGTGIAHLTAVDDPLTGEGEALFNVTRLRRDFGANSFAGATYTDRSVLDGDGYNRVLAADVHHVFATLYYFEAQLGGAWTRDTEGERDAPIWKLELDRTGRSWGFNYRVDGIGEGFVSRAGFVPRADIVTAHGFNRFSIYGSEGAAIENFTFFVGPTRLWHYGEVGAGDAIEGSEELGTFVDLRGGWHISTMLERQFFVLDPADYAGLQVAGETVPYVPLEEVSGPIASLTANTPAYRRFDLSAGIGYGRVPIFPEGAEGNETSVSGTLNLRPHESIRLSASTLYERLTRARDGSVFARTIIPRAAVELQPNRAVFFRAIAEYRSEHRDALVDARTGAPLVFSDGGLAGEQRIDAVRFDLLASYEPTPGTVAFLGYGSTLDTDDAFAFSHLERSIDGFFLKLAYQFRR